MLLGTLGAILLENLLTGKEIKAKIPDAGSLIPTHSLTNFRIQNRIIKANLNLMLFIQEISCLK